MENGPGFVDNLAHRLDRARQIGSAREDDATEALKAQLFETSQQPGLVERAMPVS